MSSYPPGSSTSSGATSAYASPTHSPRIARHGLLSFSKTAYIMVVDDQRFARLATITQLAHKNLPVILVENGEQAVLAMQGKKFKQASDDFYHPILPPMLTPYTQMLDIEEQSLAELTLSSRSHPAIDRKASKEAQSFQDPKTYSLDELCASVAVIIMDKDMPPGIDGLEATRQIRTYEEADLSLHTPIYLYTANEKLANEEETTTPEFSEKYQLDACILKKGTYPLIPFLDKFQEIINRKNENLS